MEFLENLLAKIAEFIASFGFRLLGAILVLVVGIFLIKWVCNLVVKAKGMQKSPKNAQTLVKNIVKISLYIVLLFTVAMIIGVPAASLVAVIGSAGLAIGLALDYKKKK